MRAAHPLVALVLLLALASIPVAGCGSNPQAVASVPPPPPVPAAFPDSTTPPRNPGQPPQPPAVSSDTGVSSSSLLPWDSQPLDVINGPDSPLKPVFFAYDSDSLDDAARSE